MVVRLTDPQICLDSTSLAVPWLRNLILNNGTNVRSAACHDLLQWHWGFERMNSADARALWFDHALLPLFLNGLIIFSLVLLYHHVNRGSWPHAHHEPLLRRINIVWSSIMILVSIYGCIRGGQIVLASQRCSLGLCHYKPETIIPWYGFGTLCFSISRFAEYFDLFIMILRGSRLRPILFIGGHHLVMSLAGFYLLADASYLEMMVGCLVFGEHAIIYGSYLLRELGIVSPKTLSRTISRSNTILLLALFMLFSQGALLLAVSPNCPAINRFTVKYAMVAYVMWIMIRFCNLAFKTNLKAHLRETLLSLDLIFEIRGSSVRMMEKDK